MSHQIGVFVSSEKVTLLKLRKAFYALLNDHTVSWTKKQSARIVSFYSSLIKVYPSSIHYSEDNREHCPWAEDILFGEGFVILTIVYSRIQEVLPTIKQLADEHQLIIYDPQINQATIVDELIEEQTEYKVWWKLW